VIACSSLLHHDQRAWAADAAPNSEELVWANLGCSRPANLSTDITAVREEWLLKGAEKYKLESERVHAVK